MSLNKPRNSKRGRKAVNSTRNLRRAPKEKDETWQAREVETFEEWCRRQEAVERFKSMAEGNGHLTLGQHCDLILRSILLSDEFVMACVLATRESREHPIRGKTATKR